MKKLTENQQGLLNKAVKRGPVRLTDNEKPDARELVKAGLGTFKRGFFTPFRVENERGEIVGES
jgi:hypothetical protein